MSRFKRYLKRGAIGAGAVIAILLIVNAVVVTIATRQFEARLKAIKAKGEPVSVAGLASKQPHPQDNAATFLRRVRDDVDAIQQELRPVFEQDGYVKGQLSAESVDAIAAAFKAYPQVIPLLERSAMATHYSPDVDYTVSPYEFLDNHLKRLQFLRAASRVLAAHAVLQHSQNPGDAPIRSCVVLFRLCRHFDREPLVISHLVALACRGIAVQRANVFLRSDRVSKAARRDLEKELARHDLMESFRLTLNSERAFGLERYREILEQGASWPVRAVFLNDANSYLDVFDAHRTLTQKPYRAVTERHLGLQTSGLGRLAGLVLPALKQAREATDRVQAKLRCLRVLNAIQLKAAAVTSEPPALNQLELRTSATLDPFTGDPLHVKSTKSGWLVYSVGANLQDDGGMLTNQKDVGVAPIP